MYVFVGGSGGGGWTQTAQVISAESAAGSMTANAAYFGNSAALYNNILVVGAPQADNGLEGGDSAGKYECVYASICSNAVTSFDCMTCFHRLSNAGMQGVDMSLPPLISIVNGRKCLGLWPTMSQKVATLDTRLTYIKMQSQWVRLNIHAVRQFLFTHYNLLYCNI